MFPTLFGCMQVRLSKKVADHIFALNDFSNFCPQVLSNIVWVYATAGKTHPRLFKKMANHIVAQGNLSGLKPQEISSILWAYATAGESHSQLFTKLADHIVALNDWVDSSHRVFPTLYGRMQLQESHTHVFSIKLLIILFLRVT
jgi:hypothetical protein